MKSFLSLLRQLSFVTVFSVLAVVVPTAAWAQTDTASTEVMIEDGELIVEDALVMEADDSMAQETGPYFFADSSLVLDKTYYGTVFAAGGQVTITGEIDGDLVVAGGTIQVDGPVRQDIYAAGGTIIINNQVLGNVIAAGGEVRLGENAEVSDSVITAGENIVLAGTILSKAYTAGNRTQVSGEVLQDLNVESERLIIDEQAFIGGQLRGQVGYPVEGVEDASRLSNLELVTSEKGEQFAKDAFKGFVVANLIFSLMSKLILILVAIWLFQGAILKGVAVLEEDWQQPLLLGTIFTFLTPVVLILVAMTIVGLPAALLGGVFYLALLLLGWILPAVWIGRMLADGKSPYLQGVIGAAGLALVGAIPVFGWVVKLVVALFGAGALLQLWRSLNVAPAKTTSRSKTTAKRSGKKK